MLPAESRSNGSRPQVQDMGSTCGRSTASSDLVFVDVIAVLEVSMPVMDVVDVVTVFDRFVTIAFVVCALVVRVDHFL